MSQYKDIPQPTDQRNVSQNDILTNYRYLSTPINVAAGVPAGILPVDHLASGDNVANPNDGFHAQVSFLDRGSPANLTNAVNSQNSDSILYAKADGGGNSQARFLNASIDLPVTYLMAAVNFDPTGAIIGNAVNVSSVVKNSSGDFKAFFTTALSDFRYIVLCQLETGSNPPNPKTVEVFNKTTGGVRVLVLKTATGTLSDPDTSCSIVVLGFF